MAGHADERLAGIEPVRLCEAVSLVRYRVEQRRQIAGIHLRVSRHDHVDVRAEFERSLVAVHDRTTDASVDLAFDQCEPGVLDLAGTCRGRIGRCVVDDDDEVDELGNGADRLADQFLFVVRWNDHRHTHVFVHFTPCILPRRECV